MKAVTLSVLVLVAALSRPAAQSRDQASPGPPDLSARVDRLFSVIDPKGSPGCAVAVIRDGRIVHKAGYGIADLDHDIPITPSTIFQVGSLAKQFTATAILLLAEDGKLTLNDEVRKHLPEFPDFGERVTIRHLLQHTSGVRDQLQLLALTGWRYTQDLITDRDVLDLIARQKALNFRPGSQYLYSNTGYTLLAQVVSRLSGMSFREFTTARIFRPLGMNHTHFRDKFREVIKGQAQAYVPLALLNRPPVNSATEEAAPAAQGRPVDGFELDVPNSDNVGPTNLLTTVEDLALWDRNFYEPKVGGPGLIQQLLQKGRLNNGVEIFYALGLGLESYRGLPTVEHPGTDAGFAADLLRFPEQRFSVALTCNRAGSAPANLARRIADIYLADQLGPVDTRNTFTPIALTSEQMAAFPGLYLDEGDKTVVRVVRKPESSALLIRREEFQAGDPLRFYAVASTRVLEFQASSTGRPATVLLKDRGQLLNTFTRMTEAPLTAAEMKAYTGEFRSLEIEQVYRIVVANGKLSLRRYRTDPAVLDPLRADLFQVGGGRVTMEFVRNAKREITGFLLSTSRILNMAFTR